MRMIDYGRHLKNEHKIIFESIQKLAFVLREHDLINSDDLIFDYFSELRNQVDQHREKLILVNLDEYVEEIHQKSDHILYQLKEHEKCFIENSKILIKIDTSELKHRRISKWKFQLRNPRLNENELNILLDQVNSNIKMIHNYIFKFKTDILMHNIEFFPTNTISFGELVVYTNKVNFSKNFAKTIRTYNQNLHRIEYIKVDKETNRIISWEDYNNIKIWNIDTGECLKTLDAHTSYVECILMIPNNKLIKVLRNIK